MLESHRLSPEIENLQNSMSQTCAFMSNDDDERYKDILNLIESHLIDSTPPPRLFFHTNNPAQNFTNPHRYTSFHHPVLTALPPPTPITPHPTEQVFVILQYDEKISTRLFAGCFEWVNQHVLHEDVEMGGRVRENWGVLIVAIVHPDSTVAYYKVYDGIHKPLEGTAGV